MIIPVRCFTCNRVLASKYFGVSPHIETYYPNDCIYDFVPLLWHNEAPLGGVMHLGRTSVMSIAKKKGIRVMQDGTGLDEIFGGYNRYTMAPDIWEKFSKIPDSIKPLLLNSIEKIMKLAKSDAIFSAV